MGEQKIKKNMIKGMTEQWKNTIKGMKEQKIKNKIKGMTECELVQSRKI